MFYLIQSNIYSDPDHHKVFEALEELGLPYFAIEFTDKVTEIDLPTDRTDIFVYGSVKLARFTKRYENWSPGSFYGGNHLYEIYSKEYGPHLLNAESSVHRFADALEWKPGEQKFIKPFQVAKIFTGKVFTETKWTDFVSRSLENPPNPLLTADALVQASVPQQIIKEARLWIVGGTVVAGVYYKFNGDVAFEREVAPEGIEFAREMLDIYEVADAFVMDICLTVDQGWKIVEVNCINSAGFYPGLNIKSLFKSLEIFFG